MEENKHVKEAEENLEKLQADKHAQYLAWLRDKQIWDTNSIRAGARQEGREEGLEKGRTEEKIETVTRMLKQGIDIEIIVNSTELTREEIEKIKEELYDSEV